VICRPLVTRCVVRYGGDESSLSCRRRESTTVQVARPELAQVSSAIPLPGGRGKGSLTPVLGSRISQHALSPQQLIESADTAMYGARAKKKLHSRHRRTVSGPLRTKVPTGPG